VARLSNMSFTKLLSVILALGLVTGCVIHDDPPPPPPDQVHDMAVGDLACYGTIEVDQVTETDYCAYGCGESHRYYCSLSTDECSRAWPDFC